MSAPKRQKVDLDGNPIVIVKCKHCGKEKGDHKAITWGCPVGRKHRTFGYTSFHPTNTFEARDKQ